MTEVRHAPAATGAPPTVDLLPVVAATWPAAETATAGGFLLRRGEGGGNRTSAASLLDPGGFDVAAAEAGMRAWGQRPLFLVRGDQDAALDAALAARGYGLHDPSIFLAVLADAIASASPDARAIPCDGPLAIMTSLWEAEGVGAARQAVMARVCAPRTWILGRDGECVAGCAFAAASDGVAMLHAVAVVTACRRRGIGAAITRGAAAWAVSVGAHTLALAVTRRNTGARALYAGLGMAEAGRYHYRRAPGEG